MLSTIYLMLRSAQRACPRLELGARLEARTASMTRRFPVFADSFTTSEPRSY
jgi:hypothetical protein